MWIGVGAGEEHAWVQGIRVVIGVVTYVMCKNELRAGHITRLSMTGVKSMVVAGSVPAAFPGPG